MIPHPRRRLVFGMVLGSMLLLLPGIFLPVLSIRGVLTKEGLAAAAPMMLERGLSDDTVAVLQSMMNPTVLAFLQATGGDIRKIIIERLGPQISAALQKDVSEVEVYSQTRSIMGAVRQLYQVGSPVPATLILLFSVVVPLAKAALVAGAIMMKSPPLQRRTLRFVEAIAKWSMADVFVVAILIAYLAVQASTVPTAGPEAGVPLVAFTATFGPGFYWFAAYCLFSLASQQATLRLVVSSTVAPKV